MEDIVMKILFLLFGLYAGVMSWLFKMAWDDVQRLKQELNELWSGCAKCQTGTLESIRELIDERFDKFMITVEQKIEQGFTKIELTWVNDGRISPKKQKKEG
jgi:hypothetical protein